MKVLAHRTFHRSLVLSTFCLSTVLGAAQAQPAIITPPTDPKAAPSKPTPGEPAPVKPAPVKPAPVKPAPVKPALIKAKPAAVVAPASAPAPTASAATTPKTTSSTTSAPPTPVTPAAPAASTSPAASAPPAAALTSTPPLEQVIGINLNGRNIEIDPAPILQQGTVYVPLRGVLENLGAKVSYDAAAARIDIVHSGKNYSLQAGQTSAVAGAEVVTLPAAPLVMNGRTFVPLRALAELFGYNVRWLAETRVVAVSDKVGAGNTPAVAVVDHRAVLRNAGRFGVAINFHDAAPNEIEPLLDNAKKAGATLIKFRFDWNTLEPVKGGAFQWPLYDLVVKEARERGLTIVGVLGNTTRWATLYPRSQNPNEWRNSPPKKNELEAWDNYVRRVVGRYKNDVQAWQVWENPATHNFRSVAKDYRIVARRASDVTREADAKAIVLAAEPGGVNLGFIEELRRNGLTARVDGVSLYPVSQWQPGVIANAEEMVLPIATLLRDPQNRNEQFWVNGLSRLSLENEDLLGPRAETVFNTKDAELRRQLVQNFSPAAQADYLVRATTLALASGMDKIFWGSLRDDLNTDRVDPVNSYFGGGLLKHDFTPRPSFAAHAKLVELIGGKTYVGALAAGPRAIVLIFEGPNKDGKNEIVGVAWAAPGQDGNSPKLAISPAHDPGVPGSIYLATNDESRVLDSTGQEIGGASGVISLNQRPIWMTKLSFKVAQQLRDGVPNSPLRLLSDETSDPDAESLRAVFAPGREGVEEGLFWRKYLGFRGSATEFAAADGQLGLKTTISRDVYNPAAGQPNIYLDVANDYLFFARGASVRVTVEVKRPIANSGPFAPKGGFNIQYDSLTGFKMTPWQVVEGGDGWATFSFDIPDVSFANRDGFDFLINTWGSKQDLVFRSVTLQRINARVAEGAANGSESKTQSSN